MSVNKNRIKVDRIKVTKSMIKTPGVIQPGDVIEVGKIISKYENKLVVKGSVYRPGIYSFEEGITVKKLIEKSEGIKPDTYFDANCNAIQRNAVK